MECCRQPRWCCLGVVRILGLGSSCLQINCFGNCPLTNLWLAGWLWICLEFGVRIKKSCLRSLMRVFLCFFFYVRFQESKRSKNYLPWTCGLVIIFLEQRKSKPGSGLDWKEDDIMLTSDIRRSSPAMRLASCVLNCQDSHHGQLRSSDFARYNM